MQYFRKTLGIAALAVTMACGMAFAQDSATSIDQQLNRTAGQLNNELDQATNQIHKSEALHQPSSVANQYGSASSIDNQIHKTVRQADNELSRDTRQIQANENLGATPMGNNDNYWTSYGNKSNAKGSYTNSQYKNDSGTGSYQNRYNNK